MCFITDIFGGGDAADAATDSANIQAGAQREALDYLKEREAIPQQFREGALQQLGGAYGLEGGSGSQQAMIDQAKASPLYASIMGGQQAGEQAILRNASATGGLRSGNAQGALTDYGSQLSNQALLESYNQQMSGLQGLATLPSNANQIAQTTTGIGTTLAQGHTAAAQAKESGTSGLLDLGLSALGLFSDRKLKDKLIKTGVENGFNTYTWKWNETANKELGLHGYSSGVLADEVELLMPEAVIERDGFKTVDYDMIGVKHGE